MLQPLLRPVAVAANDRLRGASPLALPAPPALDLDFVGRPSLRYPGLPPITFARASTAARVDASGRIETVSADAPRFDHHPLTGARLGLLIEEARTNLILRSEDFAHAAWTKDNAAAAPLSPSPDGVNDAQRLAEDSGSGQHRARQTVAASFAANAPLSVSCFLKAAGRGFATLQFGAANGFRACFDLAGGTLASGFAGASFGTGTFVSAGVQRFPGGWLRCWIIGKEDPAATVGEAYLNIVRSAAYTDSYTGDGASGVLAWGYQVEAGTFPTSYIASAGATGTRAAEFPSFSVLTPWFNANAGTMFMTVVPYGTGKAQPLFVIADSSDANVFDLRVRASAKAGLQVNTGTPVAALSSTASVVPGTLIRLAGAYAVNDFSSSLDGEASVTGSTGALPVVDRVELGRNTISSYATCVHLRRAAYWPHRLPKSVLQAITRA